MSPVHLYTRKTQEQDIQSTTPFFAASDSPLVGAKKARPTLIYFCHSPENKTPVTRFSCENPSAK